MKNMGIRIFLVLVIITELESCYSLSLTASFSGVVPDSNTFIYQKFPVPPSKRAIIEVNVSYPKYHEYAGYLPKMGIYTTHDHVNIRRQCIYSDDGQLGNGNLHPGIGDGRPRWTRPLKCGLQYITNTIHCTGNITVQDFIPRKFSFSFGLFCSLLRRNVSLRGLVYNISIHGTNETNCIKLPRDAINLCYRYVQYAVFPNLQGSENMSSLQSYFKSRKSDRKRGYYQNSDEYDCRLNIPRCDPVTKLIVPPCKEMCHDYRTAIQVWDAYCDYLPSSKGDVPCFYEPVRCGRLPYGNKIINSTSKRSFEYFVNDTAEYYCDMPLTKLEGNKIIRCKYDGQWSGTPRCVDVLRPTKLFEVLQLMLILFVVILIIWITQWKCRNKRKTKNEASARNREYDAFVCYCYDGQDPDFAEKIIPQELEEEHNLNLCIHRRDFKAGWDIKWNIMNAIRNSNSAIIIMSQDYMNSLWCVEEFEDCYIENMKDTAFKLFVVLMQPTDTLNVTNEYIQSFFRKETYLERDDPKLFQKIAEYLIQVKQIQKAPEGTTGEAIDPLLENYAQNEAEENNGRIIEENIQLQILNHKIDVNSDHLTEDDESGDELPEKRDTGTILKDDKNHERMQLRVEVHSHDVGDTG